MNSKLQIIAIISAVFALGACKSKDKAEDKAETTVAEPTAPEKTADTEPTAPEVAIPKKTGGTTEEVLNHHLQSFGAGKVDEILADYADDAVFVSPMGIIKGKEGLTAFFEGLVKEFSHPDVKFTMGKKMVKGELAYVTWSAETAVNSYELATDTMVIVDGKIVAQTFAGKITPKAPPADKADAPKEAPLAESPTQAVLMHHLGAFGERKMDEVLADYTPETIVLTQMGEMIGADGVKPLFEGLFTEFAKKGVKFEMGKMIVEGDIALITWSAETPDNKYEFATDTYIIREGKIVYQTLAAIITPAKG